MSRYEYVLDETQKVKMKEFYGLLDYSSFKPNFLQNIAIKMLSTGPLPQHVALIMDGNRRWAKENNLSPAEGHKHGLRSIDKLCHWMEYFDIPEATFYALSTDNFKRPKEELDALMKILYNSMRKIIKKIDILNEHGVKVSIWGNLESLHPTLQAMAAKIILETKDNKIRKVNLAIAYKSTEEIERALKLMKTGVDNGEIKPTDIDQELVEKCLYTKGVSTPNMVVRTSGEYRLSDFLLWQCSDKLIYITEKKWPELSFTDVIKALFYYQRNESVLRRINNKREVIIDEDKKSRIENFLKMTELRRIHYLQSLIETNE